MITEVESSEHLQVARSGYLSSKYHKYEFLNYILSSPDMCKKPLDGHTFLGCGPQLSTLCRLTCQYVQN